MTGPEIFFFTVSYATVAGYVYLFLSMFVLAAVLHQIPSREVVFTVYKHAMEQITPTVSKTMMLIYMVLYISKL